MGSANAKAAYKTNQNYINKYNIDKASHSLNWKLQIHFSKYKP